MNSNSLRGILAEDKEDHEFVRFFQLVQDKASAMDSVFFLWSPECHDGKVGNIWCEDLSGWLIPSKDADAFEPLWAARDSKIWSKELEPTQVFARWSESSDGAVGIRFEFPLA